MKKLSVLLLLTISCSSTPEPPEARPHPAAYSMDDFSSYTPLPDRKPKRLKFYFKECSVHESKAYYSRTSYICDDLNH